jgi:hypothetical protein
MALMACALVHPAGAAAPIGRNPLLRPLGRAPLAPARCLATVTAATAVPRLSRGALQAAALTAAGTWWLGSIISAHGLATSSAQLTPARLIQNRICFA